MRYGSPSAARSHAPPMVVQPLQCSLSAPEFQSFASPVALQMQVDVVGRLAELPGRLRPRARAVEKTWPLSTSDLRRVRIMWPSKYRWPAGGGILETQKDGLAGLGVLAVGDVDQ